MRKGFIWTRCPLLYLFEFNDLYKKIDRIFYKARASVYEYTNAITNILINQKKLYENCRDH